MPGPSARFVFAEAREEQSDPSVLRGVALPARYRRPWAGYFTELAAPQLRPGSNVLDVGSGRRPAVSAGQRAELEYVGLDRSAKELSLAGDDAYSEVVVGGVEEHFAALDDRFDLVLSYQVLEHVYSLDLALENIRSYLRPGGVLVALLSGRYSFVSLINRAISTSWARRLNDTLLGRDPSTVFRAHYHRCYASAIRAMTREWTEMMIEPRWGAAPYFGFSRLALRTYLMAENAIARGGWEDLATHYFLRGRR
jgi:SAM-dependent methyltransferase